MALLMLKKLSILSLLFVITACGATQSAKTDFWQRSASHSALYLQGPQAQQILEENIATCVAEIEELVRLGAVRTALPENARNTNNPYETPRSDANAFWNVPQRFGHKFVDHSNYHDFDSCMRYNGWTRVAYNDYETIHMSNDTYKRLHNERRGLRHDAMGAGGANGVNNTPQYND